MIQKVQLVPSTRFLITVVSHLGMALLYIQRYNFSFAILCMVDNEIPDQESTETNNATRDHNNITSVTAGRLPNKPNEFSWSREFTGHALAIFFYGYVGALVFGGWAADVFGGRRCALAGQVALSIGSVLLPEATRLSRYCLLAIRFIQGVASAIIPTALVAMVNQWSTPTENALLFSLTWAGTYVGMAVSFPIGGFLCDSTILGGWPAIFYLSGCLGMLWSFVAYFSIYDSPNTHPRVAIEEKKYLSDHLSHLNESQEKKVVVPWASIFRCLPVWCVILGNFCYTWGFYTVSITMPLYMRDVNHFDIKQNSFWSSLPWIFQTITLITFGKLFHIIRHKGLVTATVLRKLFYTAGMIAGGGALLGPLFVSHIDVILSCWILAAGQGLATFAMAGGAINAGADLAPQYSGVIMSLGSALANSCGFIIPLVTSYITKHGTFEEWSRVFYISIGVSCFGVLFFTLFWSSELQSWAKPSSHQEKTSTSQQEKELQVWSTRL